MPADASMANTFEPMNDDAASRCGAIDRRDVLPPACGSIPTTAGLGIGDVAVKSNPILW
jgi:hypothetical protein